MQIQISKIQHRRGLLEELEGVNLSAAELGWAMNRRRLFIGNGEIAEGAADVGNTEVFTEHSDHLRLMRHRYAANVVDPITGQITPSVNESWQAPRSLQDRLDERVSVRSFDVRGDGSVDAIDVRAETLNIRRALFELYLKRGYDTDYVVNPNYAGSWKALYWPAGVYVIDQPIPLLRKSIWIGDGSGRTVIVMRNANPVYNFVVGTALFNRPEFGYPSDSELLNQGPTGQQFTFNFTVPQSPVGNYLGYPVEDVLVSGITFINDNDAGDVARLTNISNAYFHDVDFFGAQFDTSLERPANGQSMPDNSPIGSKCVHIRSTAVGGEIDYQSNNIGFMNCRFANRGFGIYSGDDSLMIDVRDSIFEKLHDGVNVGENLNNLGTRVANAGTKSLQVHASLFHRIRRHSMAVYSTAGGNASENNRHEAVGTPLNATGMPISTDPADADYPIVWLGDDAHRNAVIADTFWREDTAIERVRHPGSLNIIIIDGFNPAANSGDYNDLENLPDLSVFLTEADMDGYVTDSDLDIYLTETEGDERYAEKIEGLRGQVPFFTTDNAAEQTASFLMQIGRFVENDNELAAAMAEEISFAEVFQSWYRFSHSTGVSTYPANETEANEWEYDDQTDQVYTTLNTSTAIGFVSGDYHEDYIHQARLSSTHSDDDAIFVVIGFVTEGTPGQAGYREHTLIAFRTNGGISNTTWAIFYNYNQSGAIDGQWLVADGASLVTNVYDHNNLQLGGWQTAGVGTVVRVERTGDTIRATTSEMGSTTLEPSTELVVDLTSDPRLEKFRGPVRYGYGARSQAEATFSDIEFVGTSQRIYHIPNDDVYEWDGSNWIINSGLTLEGEVGTGRMIYNPKTTKMWFIRSLRDVVPLVGGSKSRKYNFPVTIDAGAYQDWDVSDVFVDPALTASMVSVEVTVLDNVGGSSTEGFYINAEGAATVARQGSTVRVINDTAQNLDFNVLFVL